jgi:uncharacterized membrane protein YeaQ/YmgE (transglycosylase-associated protein family)
MNFLAWIFLGLIAGALAKFIYPGRQGGGIFSTMILGIVGAFIGGTLHTLATTGKFELGAASGTGFWVSLGIAIIGSMIAIFLWGLFTRKAT